MVWFTRPAGLVCVLAFSMATLELRRAAEQQNDVDFSKPGPCGTTALATTLALPPDVQAAFLSSLPLNVTLPVTCGEQGPQGPFPVLMFFNGFQARASSYHLLVQRLASWGHVVVQYDTPMLRIFAITDEMKAFEPLVEWLASENKSGNGTSPLEGLLDLDRLLVAGHSRGGKLAALLFAGNPSIAASYLVDPVDFSRFSPESPTNPSGSKALTRSGRAVGLSGAGLTGSCNPQGENVEKFWAAAVNGSWLSLIPNASHTQFMDAGCALNAAMDLVCGKGSTRRPVIAELTATPMLAWFYNALAQDASSGNGTGPTPQPLRAFFEWVGVQQGAGLLEFSIKGGQLPEKALAAGAGKGVLVPGGGDGADDALAEEC